MDYTLTITTSEDNKYVLKKQIDPKWIDEYGYKELLQRYNGTKILRDPFGNCFVADIIVQIPYFEIENYDRLLTMKGIIEDAQKKENN